MLRPTVLFIKEKEKKRQEKEGDKKNRKTRV
jgi:hypothetical protein